MGDVELVSRSVQLEHKLFYLDLKDNPRGRYLKISERSTVNRSTILVPLAGVVWFVDLFNYYANGGENGQLSSKELQLDTKVFFFDVGENPRGRYLKVSEASKVRGRSTIMVPAAGAAGGVEDGWALFRNALAEIHEASLALPPAAESSAPAVTGYAAAPTAGAAAAGAAPSPAAPSAAPVGGGSSISSSTVSRVINAEQKRFFLDLGSNARGQFLKISEVLGMDRSSIIVPASALTQLHNAIGQLLAVAQEQGSLAPPAPSAPIVRTLGPPPPKRADN